MRASFLNISSYFYVGLKKCLERVEHLNFCLFLRHHAPVLTRNCFSKVRTYYSLQIYFISSTGWSRKIETVKLGCNYCRGRIGFKISVCKIRFIILHKKYPIPFQIIQYTRDFYNTSKLKVRPLCSMPHFLLKTLWEVDKHWCRKKFMLHFEYMIQGFFWHIGSNFVSLSSRAISKSLST